MKPLWKISDFKLSGKINIFCHLVFYCVLIYSSYTYFSYAYASALKHDPQFFLEQSRTQRSQNITWEKVVSFRFDNPGEIAECPVPEGKWKVKDGKLHAIEGDKNRAILLHHCVGEAVRIEFEATCFTDNQGRLGDITVLLNSVHGKAFFGNGYALTTASYWNNCSTFYRKGRPIARTEYTPVKSGERNLVILEFNKGHIRYWLNGQIILEAWDETPLEINSEYWIGIRTWATNMTVDNLIIFKEKP